MSPLYIGCAGWSLNRTLQAHFPESGSHLERYASVFRAVEINSSFYRPHRAATYRRWAASVPADFRFSAKLPRTITHGHRLVDAQALLDTFLGEVTTLGDKLGPLLVQLPPSLAFEAADAAAFLRDFRARFDGDICVEPRHASWFVGAADDVLEKYAVARVAADPSLDEAASLPSAWTPLRYTRLHGSPHMYHSNYDDARLRAYAQRLHDEQKHGGTVWCIFDNTAQGHAVPNALEMVRLSSAR